MFQKMLNDIIRYEQGGVKKLTFSNIVIVYRISWLFFFDAVYFEFCFVYKSHMTIRRRSKTQYTAADSVIMLFRA